MITTVKIKSTVDGQKDLFMNVSPKYQQSIETREKKSEELTQPF
jgi:hypothetical protein